MKHMKRVLLTLITALFLLLSACGVEQKEPEPERSPISPPSIQPDSVTGASLAVNRDSGISGSLPRGGNSAVIVSPLGGDDRTVDNSSGGDSSSAGGNNDVVDSDGGGASDNAGSNDTDNASAGGIDLPVISVRDLQS